MRHTLLTYTIGLTTGILITSGAWLYATPSKDEVVMQAALEMADKVKFDLDKKKIPTERQYYLAYKYYTRRLESCTVTMNTIHGMTQPTKEEYERIQ